MPDWTKPMIQTFEYYEIDPLTWKEKRKINTVKSSSIDRDSTNETKGSANIVISDFVGECYIRTYLVITQNGITERFVLGTHIVQTTPTEFDGKIFSTSVDAYTPLLELKENPPPLGYYIPKDSNILDSAYLLVREHARAPVIPTTNTENAYTDFVSNTDDTWLSFISDLLSTLKYSLDVDEYGQILFVPYQDTATLQPVWTYNDDNSSILYPTLSLDYDVYGVPNVVEVIYSNGKTILQSQAINDNENSPVSIQNRGREILYRVVNPEGLMVSTQAQLDDYTKKLLKTVSSIEYTISYKHGYCPVRVGDCVRLNYEKAGISGIKAKVISQNIECVPGCPVSEKASFTVNLWEGGINNVI